MKLLSEMLSKRILNVYSTKIEGVICSAVFDGKKIPYLKYFDHGEDEYLLDTSKIYCSQNDLVVIKNDTAIMPATNIEDKGRLLGLEAISDRGKLLGKITDIELSDTYRVCALYIDKNRLDISKVMSIGDIVIVKENEKTNWSHFKPQKPKIKKQNATGIVSILPEEDGEEKPKFDNNKITLVEKLISKENDTKQNEYKISISPAPQKIVGVGTGRYLIGRKALKAIYGINNELLIKKDMIVTEEILDRIKNHSKLMELALFTKDRESTKETT